MSPPGPPIAPGSRVTLHFSLSLHDGTEAISTFDEEPLRFTLGDGSLVEGLELALYGMRAGQEQTLSLTPDQAFGERDADKIHDMPRDRFPDDMPLEAGSLVAFDGPDGEPLAGTVVSLGERQVRIDFNHPLAGHPIVFRSRILEVIDPGAPDP